MRFVSLSHKLSRPFVDIFWHAFLDGFHDGLGQLKREGTVLHDMTRRVERQGEQRPSGQFQPAIEKAHCFMLYLNSKLNGKPSILEKLTEAK